MPEILVEALVFVGVMIVIYALLSGVHTHGSTISRGAKAVGRALLGFGMIVGFMILAGLLAYMIGAMGPHLGLLAIIAVAALVIVARLDDLGHRPFR